MPTYTYECPKCSHAQDEFHAMSAAPKIKCDQCGTKSQKMIGTGAGIIFKGSGFYETDYKDKKGTPPTKSSAKKDNKAEKKAEKPAASKSSATAKNN